MDIKRFCCSGITPLGFDKTYNLGEVFVTASAYKQLAVLNTQTDDHPIMLGPTFLHRSSTFEAYSPLFSILASSLSDINTSKLVIGSDDEAALRKAIKFNFPSAKNMLCTRHLRENATHYLQNKVGLGQSERQSLLKSIFGTNGLTSAENFDIFEDRLTSLKEEISVTAPYFEKYFCSRLTPAIKDGVVEISTESARIKSAQWNNNNCESINHVLVKTAC